MAIDIPATRFALTDFRVDRFRSAAILLGLLLLHSLFSPADVAAIPTVELEWFGTGTPYHTVLPGTTVTLETSVVSDTGLSAAGVSPSFEHAQLQHQASFDRCPIYCPPGWQAFSPPPSTQILDSVTSAVVNMDAYKIPGDPFDVDLQFGESWFSALTPGCAMVNTYYRPGIDVIVDYPDLGSSKPAATAFLRIASSSLEEGLIGHWDLDGDGIEACGVDGDVIGAAAATGVLGEPDSALEFEGGADLVDLGTSPYLKPNFPMTIAMYLKHDCAFGTGCYLFWNDYNPPNYSGVTLRLATNLTLYTLIGDGGVAASYNRRDASAPPVLDADVWYHVAVVINSPTDVEFYVDGAMVDPGSISYGGTGGIMAYANPPAPAYIGYGAVTSPVPYEGVLDEVRFYNRALSPGEITMLPEPGFVPGLTAGALLLGLVAKRRGLRR